MAGSKLKKKKKKKKNICENPYLGPNNMEIIFLPKMYLTWNNKLNYISSLDSSLGSISTWRVGGPQFLISARNQINCNELTYSHAWGHTFLCCVACINCLTQVLDFYLGHL